MNSVVGRAGDQTQGLTLCTLYHRVCHLPSYSSGNSGKADNHQEDKQIRRKIHAVFQIITFTKEVHSSVLPRT